jgi:hypothetical protein
MTCQACSTEIPSGAAHVWFGTHLFEAYCPRCCPKTDPDSGERCEKCFQVISTKREETP